MLRVLRWSVDSRRPAGRGCQQALLGFPGAKRRGHRSTRIKVPSTSHQSSSPRTQATVQVQERGRGATATHSGKLGKLRPISVSRSETFTTSGAMAICSELEQAKPRSSGKELMGAAATFQ